MGLLRSRDGYFLAVKILTLVACLPWPLTLVATAMSLAGRFAEGTPVAVRLLVRGLWLLLAAYPLVFFGVVYVAERVVAPRAYGLAAGLALVPVVAAAGAVGWLLRP